MQFLQSAGLTSTNPLCPPRRWVLPLHHFVGLSKLLTHQELLKQGKLARYDSSMRAVFFVSHQWTSFTHPDPTGEQLRCFQRQLLKMLEGSAADVEPGFADKMFLSKGATVSGAEWKRLLEGGHVFLWMDYFSVPVSVRVFARIIALGVGVFDSCCSKFASPANRQLQRP